jgi:hypothetical protein
VVRQDVFRNGNHMIVFVEKNNINGELHAERVYPLTRPDQQPFSIIQGVSSQKAFHSAEDAFSDCQSACQYLVFGRIDSSHLWCARTRSAVTDNFVGTDDKSAPTKLSTSDLGALIISSELSHR